MRKRITALRRLMAKEGLSAMLVSDLPNVRYLCGFTGSNGALLVTQRNAWFFTDFRYKEQMKREVRGCRCEMRKRDLYADFPTRHLKGIKKLGIEEAYLSVYRFNLLKRQLRKVRFVPAKGIVLRLRRRKEPSEFELIRKAQAVTDRVFREIIARLRPGMVERDLAAEIEFRFRQAGESAFPAIVASGPNAAMPHAEPSRRRLRSRDVVTFDIGCRYQGYCSDMTRTVFLGKPEPDLAQVYYIVLEAQKRALDAIRPGAKCAEVDARARDYIRGMGYGECFGHGLGHGVGIEVHEQPGLHATAKDRLAPGDVVTIEPGIYIPGLGGVRIEDMVLVRSDGYENLTRSPKRLIQL